MNITVTDLHGQDIQFECGDTWVSKWMCEPILEGKTYPALPFLTDVKVVFDVGANCGAAAVHFARHYPGGTVHAFEPGSQQRALLERNAATHDNIVVHPIGLHSNDQTAALYMGTEDSGTSSIYPSHSNVEANEQVELRSALGWAREHGINHIDVLKLDVEGCEVDVLSSLEPLLATVQVLYVEYDSRVARRQIDDLVRDTHELFFAMFMGLDQGECMYLRKDLADHPNVTAALRSMLRPEPA